MAGTTSKPATSAVVKGDSPETDPRHPDTVSDKIETLNPSEVSAADLDPESYGFAPIDTKGAEEAYAAGPGFVEPVRAASVATPENSTFASRAGARTKVVNNTSSGVVEK